MCKPSSMQYVGKALSRGHNFPVVCVIQNTPAQPYDFIV
jgi:hypothetical protein